MRATDTDISDILLNETLYKTQENISIYDISYKSFNSSKPLCIRFYAVDRFIKIYDGIRHLVLFDSGLYDATYYRIRYLISGRSGITDSINLNFA